LCVPFHLTIANCTKGIFLGSVQTYLCTSLTLLYIDHFVPVLPPRIITHPTDTTAAAPFNGVFTCIAEGNGHRNITWYRKHVFRELLPEKCTTSQVSSPEITTSTLIVPNVTDEDVGKYYCVVWANELAARSKSATLYATSMLL